MQDEKRIRMAPEKERVLELFRQKGMRVTKQRILLLDIILEQEYTSCKEVYFQARKKDKSIGIATVYRMLNTLTELGIFQVRTPYRLSDEVLK